jgi:maltooligosyltrehalose trehalohydrolase
MQRASGGWWVAQPLPPGVDYTFMIDGEGPFPDPRSPFQPHGINGPSRTIDHAAFPWTDQRWQPPPLASAVIYELHVGTFSEEGTFDGVIAKLDHLVRLGITHVELMPVCEFPGARGWGYDGVDLFAPHHAYGGPDGLKRLVNACHERGLALILDVVYNHLGPAGNYLGRFGPYFTDRYRTPWGDAVNLDGPGSDDVRRFFCDNALMWLRDYHMDGLRLDAVHALVDTSAVPFLEQLATEVALLQGAAGRHLVLIAESDLNDPQLVRPRECGGYGLDAQWSDDFHHALHSTLTGEHAGYYEDFAGLADLAATIQNGFLYRGQYSRHRQRTHGRSTRGLPGWRFVVAAQNHDQIGNRATGERLSQLVSGDRLKIAAALLLTAPFVPMLFQGEEWGASSPFLYFTDHGDDTLGAAVRDGRRHEFAAFGWNPADIPDPQSPQTVERSRLRWPEIASPPHAELLAWHRSLIRLRRAVLPLSDGTHAATRVAYDAGGHWIVVRRAGLQIACNLSGRGQTIATPKARDLLLASRPEVRLCQNAVELPPDAVAIVADQADVGQTFVAVD